MAYSDISQMQKIHIPLCQSSKCKVRLKNLSAALTSRDLTCLLNYKPNAKYSEAFREGFEGCLYTIIHRCPTLWKNIRICKDLFSDVKKIITVSLTGEESSDEDFDGLFSDRIVFDICDDNELQEFADRVKDFIEEESFDPEPYKAAESIHPYSSANSYNEPDGVDFVVEADDYESYCPYFDIFGRNAPQVFVRSSSVQFAKDSQDGGPQDGRKLKDEINNFGSKSKSHVWSRIKTIFHEILPGLYNSCNVLGLVDIAVCNNPVLQTRAITLLEFHLLSCHGAEKGLDLRTLLKMESFISCCLKEDRKAYGTSNGDRVKLAIIQKLSNLYLMLLCEMILVVESTSQIDTFNVHINTVCGRQFATGKTKADTSLDDLDRILKDINSKGVAQVKSITNKFVHQDHQKVKDLLKRSLSSQAVIVFDSLKKICQFLDNNALELLRKYVMQTKTGSFIFGIGIKDAPMSCIIMLMQGMTHFLSYSIDQMTDKDVHDLGQKATEVIKYASSRSLPNEVGRLLQTLFFNIMPDVRKTIILLYQERGSFEPNLVLFLQNEVERILRPLLTINKSSKDDYKEKILTNWKLYPGYFDNKPILLILHKPLVSDHVDRNESRFIKDDCHMKEMSVLQHLQHKNIIKLWAFQKSPIPQFYIVEEYLKSNLQMALKNSNISQRFYSKRQLYTFLFDAASALEYCHSKDYVHRNITAASLFICQQSDKSCIVKLCGFQLSRKLHKGMIKGVYKVVQY